MLQRQHLVCMPNGEAVILNESTLIPEGRTSLGLGGDAGFLGGGFLSYQNAGRLHKSQAPIVNTAVKGVYDARIQNLSRHGANPLGRTLLGWTMEDRATVGLKNKTAKAEAKLRAQSELAAYTTYVKMGGNPDISGCRAEHTPVVPALEPTPSAPAAPTPTKYTPLR